MINWSKCFDEPKKKKKNDMSRYDNIWKIRTGQGDDYTTGCLLDFPYFKENYKLTEVGLSK